MSNPNLNPRPKIQIFILARDRPEYFIQVVNSAINQEAGNYEIEVVISDNSKSSTIKEIAEINFPDVKYVRRCPATDAATHFSRVISEATGDLIVLFHDDDLLTAQYCKKTVEAFMEHPDASVVGCNAIKIDSKDNEIGLFNTHKNKKIIKDEKWFLGQYITRDDPEKGIAPFPSYCYKREFLDISHVNERDGGKYSDATFVSKKIKLGPIVWLSEPLMKYRVHAGADSATLEINDYRKLWRYMVSKGMCKHEPPFSEWRYSLWMSWYINRTARRKIIFTPLTWRESIVHKAYLKLFISRPGRTYLKMLAGYLWYRLIK